MPPEQVQRYVTWPIEGFLKPDPELLVPWTEPAQGVAGRQPDGWQSLQILADHDDLVVVQHDLLRFKRSAQMSASLPTAEDLTIEGVNQSQPDERQIRLDDLDR
jgi:hypothetical protein